MKKILLLLMLAAGFNVAANAQDKPVSFGIKAGVAFPNMAFSNEIASRNTHSKTSFYVGAIADINVSPLFSFQTGLTYVGKGGEFNMRKAMEEIGIDPSVLEGNDIFTFNYSYLELPMNLLANFKVGEGKFFIGTGPYVAYALSANTENTEKDNLEFGSEEGQYKRLEFGINFLGGYKLANGLNLHTGYGLGLTTIQNSSENSTKNKVFSVGLGFNF